jgi:cAMP-dependent protein kinase regulator
MGCGSSKSATVKEGGAGCTTNEVTAAVEAETRTTNASSRGFQFFLPSEPGTGLIGMFQGVGKMAMEALVSPVNTASELFSLNNTTRSNTTNQHPTKKPGGVVAKTTARRVRFNNVCAARIDDWEHFIPPSHPKVKSEKTFLTESLKNNFCFSSLSESELLTIINAMVQVDANKDDTIITQGESGDYFYVIKHGVVHYQVNGKKVGQATRGHSFGELALLYTSPRAATVIADVPCALYRLDQKTFRYTLQMQTLDSEKDKMELLMGVKFLQELDMKDVNKLIKCLVPRKFDAGEYLVNKGDVGDTFYLIQDGQVEVTDIVVGHTTYENQVLGPGEYFGERALVTKEPRSANCVGKTSGIALTIDQETFEKVVGSLSRLVLKCQDKRVLVRETSDGYGGDTINDRDEDFETVACLLMWRRFIQSLTP